MSSGAHSDQTRFFKDYYLFRMEAVSVRTSVNLAGETEDVQEKLASLEKKTVELEQSMRYAGSLQQSVLPNERIFRNTFEDAFVLFKPKDIVSGDFYWIANYDNAVYIAVADCTGHGIPGALLNIAGNTILRHIIRTEGVEDPAKIIALLDEELTALFNDNRTNGQTRDGMDIVLCKFNLTTLSGACCTAGRPLIMIRNEELHEIPRTSSCVGYSDEQDKVFDTIEFSIAKGDRYYLFTDGYTDQFGGDNIKKFNRKRFRNMLKALDEYSLPKQKDLLDLSFTDWKGQLEQIDDVCVVGVEI